MTVDHLRRELVEWTFALSVSIVFCAIAVRVVLWMVSP